MTIEKARRTFTWIALAPAGLLYVGVLLAVRHPRTAKIASAGLLGLGLVSFVGWVAQ